MQQAPPYTSAIAGNKWWESDSQGNQEVGGRLIQRKGKERRERGEEGNPAVWKHHIKGQCAAGQRWKCI